jgi:hypothetical protein
MILKKNAGDRELSEPLALEAQPAHLASPTPTQKRILSPEMEVYLATCQRTSVTQEQRGLTHLDAKGRPVTIAWWKQVHVQQARWLELTVLRVVRPHAANTERDPRVSWFVWIGDASVDLSSIALGYVRRFGQEHGYRFDKQALLWEKARLRTPEQFERWSLVVAMAHNQLVLARSVVEPELRPWENRQRLPTPQHVRRGIGKFLPRLGTPARPVQARGKSPGRSIGVKMGKAKQFSVVRKTPKLPPLVPIEPLFLLAHWSSLISRNSLWSSGRSSLV